MENFEIKTPSRGKYIGVWFLNSIIGSILVFGLDNFLAQFLFNNVNSINDIYLGMFIAVAVESIAFLLISIFIYGYFNDLKISKVIPYAYFFWSLSYFRGYMDVEREFTGVDISLSPIAITFLACWLFTILGFRFYFRKKDNWS